MMVDLLGQLETSYETRKGYWKGDRRRYRLWRRHHPRFTELKAMTASRSIRRLRSFTRCA